MKDPEIIEADNPYDPASNSPHRKNNSQAKGGCLRNCLYVAGIVLSGLYLINPTFGIYELIPDNFPIIGNLDEAGAVILLLRCLSYFGINLIPPRDRDE